MIGVFAFDEGTDFPEPISSSAHMIFIIMVKVLAQRSRDSDREEKLR
jgi:hypothetical protein